ncbi:OmpH family outer membrane protein [Anaerosinus gibii]|uniref:OmpH family outer membrane protein n=1 Tax=Selenobaculum gibii TaxID=3054208 RepID=A0A9Y2AK48_9FIRM|nr:OmpH family outer membrane protein [Selenobaculum gbiensis]WIW71376.1 OmpH family outer membrane protein [Selenobaculum gbiensis]
MKKIFLAVMVSVVCLFGLANGGISKAEAAESLGYVNLQAVFAAYPNINKAEMTLQQEQQKSQQEYHSRAATLNDAEKMALEKELNQALAKKQLEVMEPIQTKINQAIAKAAQAKGIHQVVKAEEMLYGGTDLTKDVIEMIK